MTVNTNPRAMKPRAIAIDEVSPPKVVEEGIPLVEEQLQTGGTRDESLLEGRILQLKFLDQVCGPVQTGNVLRGVNGECLRLALVDWDEQIVVSCGPVQVEIVLLHNDGNGLITQENFKTRIIKTGEKKKPHFAKPVFVSLKEGVGDLSGVRLGQDSGWTNSCCCSLGATVVQNPGGTAAQDAWTLPFKVEDNRSKRNKKDYPPLLSSQAWRLEGIGRNGEPCKRLDERNVETVQDFLFWYYVKPKELKQILKVGPIPWTTIVTHAKTCRIDDRRMYSHRCPNEPQRSVVYDAVGRLKGVIKECHFVAVDNMSADEKDRARDLLVSVLEGTAFGERYDSPFDIESSGITNASLQQCSDGSRLAFPDNASRYQTRERGSSSQSILPFPDPEVTNLDNHVLQQGNVDPFEDTYWQLLIGGESSSRRSNASFCSLDSMEKDQYLCGDDDDKYWGTKNWLSQGPPSPNSLNYYASDDTTSHNNRTYGCGNESYADAPAQPQLISSTSGNESRADASAQPQLVSSTGGNESCADVVSTSGNKPGAAASAEPPTQAVHANRWKSSISKLLASIREKMSLDFIRTHKKRKIG